MIRLIIVRFYLKYANSGIECDIIFYNLIEIKIIKD